MNPDNSPEELTSIVDRFIDEFRTKLEEISKERSDPVACECITASIVKLVEFVIELKKERTEIQFETDPLSVEIKDCEGIAPRKSLLNILRHFTTIGELNQITEIDLHRKRHCGRGTIIAAQRLLDYFGLQFKKEPKK
jgi:hypothetical protein